MDLQHFLGNQEDIRYLAELLGKERINHFLELASYISEEAPSMKEFEDFVYILSLLRFMEEQKELPWWKSENFAVSCFYQLKYLRDGILLVSSERLQCGMHLLFWETLLFKKKCSKILAMIKDGDERKYRRIIKRARKKALPIMPEEFAKFA